MSFVFSNSSLPITCNGRDVRPQTKNTEVTRIRPRSTLRGPKGDDHPGSTRPHNEAEKAADGIESNRSSTTVTGSRREKSQRAEESLDLVCGCFGLEGGQELMSRDVDFF
jgi:hypothetical protein